MPKTRQFVVENNAKIKNAEPKYTSLRFVRVARWPGSRRRRFVYNSREQAYENNRPPTEFSARTMLACNCAILCALRAMILPTLLMAAAQFDTAKNLPGANVTYAWKANGSLPRHVAGVRDAGRAREKYVNDFRTTDETVSENVIRTVVTENVSAGLAGANADRVRGANRLLAKNVTGIRRRSDTTVAGNVVASGSKVAVGSVASKNVTGEVQKTDGPATTQAADNDRDTRRDARQVEQRNERCVAAVPLQLFGDEDVSELEDVVSGRAYASSTADRYRIRPVAAYYDNSVVRYRRVRPVAVFARRRRPVVMFDRPGPEHGPTAADAGQLFYYDVPAEVAGRTPIRIGSPHAQNVLAANDRESKGQVESQWTADDVRRLLQRVYSEGVTAGQAASEMDRKPKTRR